MGGKTPRSRSGLVQTANWSFVPKSKPSADLFARLDAWLKKHRKRYFRALLQGATAGTLEALSARLGVAMPDDLRRLLTWHDGQAPDFPGRFEQDWALMSCEEIAAVKSELDADAASTGWSPVWVPFLDDDAGDFLCLDTSQPGSPVRAFWLGRCDHPIISPSLMAWLEDFEKALERGEYVEDPERGSFLRKV